MYQLHKILNKLNAGNSGVRSAAEQQISLPDIMVRSFAQVKELAGDKLSWGEKNFLYQQAQKEMKENKMAESRILSRANPQLANAVRLGLRQSAMLGDYNDLFPARAGSFVKPGSVASMFSPAGYLTELYREARGLHAENSPYHLDARRPDLASLSLSQTNMDDELSTLSLSNELLLNNIQQQESKDYDGVLEMLATYRQTGATPYNQPYEAVRQSIILQDPEFTAFRNNPSVATKMDAASLLGIQADISPELREILTEEITEANADELIKKNFGDIDPSNFQNIAYLANWYGLTYDEMDSLLTLVNVADNPAAGIQYYQNDQLISLVGSDGKLNARLITRTALEDNNHLNYCELIPVSAGNYQLNVNFINKEPDYPLFRIGTTANGAEIYRLNDFIPEANKPYQYACAFTDEQLETGVDIYIRRMREGGYQFASSIRFTSENYSFSAFMLKLNKLIRLYKATGISPSDIRTVIESVNDDLSITDDVLSRLFWANYYAQLYCVDFSAGLVLAGATISQISHGGQDSAFTRLFNTPPLNNQLFFADGTVLNPEPGKSEDAFRLAVLKRALQVDDTGLYTLYTLTFTDKDSADKAIDFTITIDNLSALYRTRLLAQVNNLSVTELSLLLSVSPYAGVKLDTLNDNRLNELSAVIERYTQWLKDMNWSVSDLYLMLTNQFSTTLSPDIENLIDTLKNGLTDQPSSRDEAGVITVVAPFIAAALQLDSAETAAAILQWLNQLEPQGQTVTDFLELVSNDSRNSEQTVQLVVFCQVMGQLALFVRGCGVNAAELTWVVTHPECLGIDYTTLKQDIDTLRDISELHTFLGRCGSHASEILTSLSGKAGSEKNNLAVKTVATALTLDETMLAQGLEQVSEYEYFYNWNGLKVTLQWLDVAITLGITPADVARLVQLTPSSPYPDWVTVSHALQAGLNAQQTVQLQASLDESLSAAVSAYVIKNMSPSWVTDRDALYSWLLIDNQVSAQVKTTRIAEAIASVQLYVNRALTGQEEGVVNAVRSKTFFTSDWDTYNKRYSTWAGVSELVYYPENYVDPTLRLGQTAMMDEMLQTLSQSQLTSDSVEEAFKTYMTRFEEIANLEVISGYHDSISDQEGTTYIIGRSGIGDYYWRSADIGKMSDGKLPANAWSEWKKITAALTPVNNLVRPVIFQSRLYLVWVESREVASYDEEKNIATNTQEYLLKYAHILHDGTWNAPVTLTPGTGTFPPEGVKVENVGIYCANDAEHDQLYIFFYQKEDDYLNIPEKIAGLSLSTDGMTDDISADTIAKTAGYIYRQLDTTTAVRLNTPYTTGSTKFSISGAHRTDYQWGYGNYSLVYNSSLTSTSASVMGDHVVVKFNAIARVVYNGCSGARSGTLVDMMKAVGSAGKIFYAPEKKMRSNVASSSGRDFECIFYGTATSIGGGSVAIQVLDTISPENGDAIRVFNYGKTDYLNKSGTSISGSLSNSNSNSKLKLWTGSIGDVNAENYLYAYMSPENRKFSTPNELLFGDFKKIDTTINADDVKLSVSGAAIGNFTADNCSKYSLAESLFNFNDTTVSVPFSAFSNNTAELSFTMSATAPASDGRSLGREVLTLTLTRVDESSMPVISLNKSTDNAQYLQYGVHRIRVNTLFAKQLVSRANAGLDSVLSMDTQNLPEPKPGEGVYIHLELESYSKEVNGDSREFRILMFNVLRGGDRYVLASGILDASQPVAVEFFLPRIAEAYGNADNLYFCAEYQNGETHGILVHKNSNKQWQVDNSHNNGTFQGLKNITLLNNQTTEPMDFNGANALYFWEMFYYVPMMVFKRLLSEGRFSEATRWIQYIWSPDGYLQNDQPATWTWNVRPLEEEITWHANPLDSVDPDAVAQADPLHYKVATFMAYLDLLIARGDAAYRQLERDTLNEAKMWYVQALNVLGNEPYQPAGSGWASPRLSDAADKTTQKNVQQALMAVRQQLTSGELRTANSLTDLFLPQQNAKLAGYWQTLAQRLFNLRNNLSIDGNPLSLAIYAQPADPSALLSAAVNAASGGSDLPEPAMPLYRFPIILDSARGMVSQLTQFGSTLLSLTERRDAEALSELLQNQGSQLMVQSIALQNSAITEIDAEKTVLDAARDGAQSRLDSYTSLYNENVNTGERQSMNMSLAASVLSTTSIVSYTVASALDAMPNIFGMAFGGSSYGSIARGMGIDIEIGASALRTAAGHIGQSEAYRRRRQEWEIQRNNAQAEVKQIDAQLASLAVRREGAVLQKTYLETQQSQTQAQLTFLQNKFTSKALYNWLRGKLAAIYYQYYDLTVSRCLMAQEAYKWGQGIDSASFIRPGAWQGTYAGLMAGETLMLNLAQMEQSWLQKDEREKEVTRTVCLSEFYASLDSEFNFESKINALLSGTATGDDTYVNGLSMSSDKKQLQATLTLSDLKISDDYPALLGKTRRIKQISVTLPALVGPYQDVRAVLSYGDAKGLAKGCDALAVSHGMNDSGQFQLDFNDGRWLPFEGIKVDSSGVFTLSFPGADDSQKALLQTLTDIILHIRYTIVS